MKNKMKKFWKWVNENKVASGVVVMVLGTGILKLIGVIFSISIFTFLCNFLGTEYVVRMWYLILLPIIPLILILLVMLALSPEEAPPSYKHYVRDDIDGILWQWKYLGTSVDEYSLLPLCMHCKRELIQQRIFDIDRGRFLLICPRGHYRREFYGTYEDVVELTMNEIAGRIRSGEYLESL